MRRILIAALFVAVILVIIRTILGTPAMRGMVEGFQNAVPGTSTLNTVTECPAGTQMYMYDGVAYCCNGQVNPDADDLQMTCKPLLARNFELTFCTLGPPGSIVPNCMELRAGQMMGKGETECPAALPNYVQAAGSTQGRCCKSMANAAFTDCVDTSAPNSFCDMTSATDISTVPNSCQFLRMKDEVAAQCPKGYSVFTMTGTGDFAGKTLAGCSDGKQSCYPKPMIDSLVAGGNNVENLTTCASPL